MHWLFADPYSFFSFNSFRIFFFPAGMDFTRCRLRAIRIVRRMARR
jgi:hypothetical protein